MKKKTVIVTGAAKGIGKIIAKTFINQVFQVVVNDLDEKALAVFADEVENSPWVFFSQGDINSESYRLNLIKKTIERFSSVDILINNVGLGSRKTILKIDADHFLHALKTNLVSPFLLSQAVAKEMVKKNTRGSILFISSIHQEIPSGDPAYSSSKAAIKMIVKELALELGHFGIRVNGIAPGRIEAKREKDKRIPLLSESGTPEDIANAVIFLSDENLANYITGQVLTVDGGLSHFFIKE